MSSPSTRSLFINSADGYGAPNAFTIYLPQVITGVSRFRVRKVVFPNVIYPFVQGTNDSFVIQVQGDEPQRITVPTNIVLYTFEQLANTVQVSLNTQTQLVWACTYDNLVNRLVLSTTTNFKVLTYYEIQNSGLNFPLSLINNNIGKSDTQSMTFKNSQTFENSPMVGYDCVYINSDLSNLALNIANARRDTLLLLPLTKSYGGIVIYNCKSVDTTPIDNDTISQINFSVSDRYGNLLPLASGTGWTIQIDFE